MNSRRLIFSFVELLSSILTRSLKNRVAFLLLLLPATTIERVAARIYSGTTAKSAIHAQCLGNGIA